MGGDRPRLHSPLRALKIFLSGMCMGAADIVPGISGGTIAFIIGIYEDLIHSIRTISSKELFSIFRLKFHPFNEKVAWDYLLVLVSGIFVAMLTLAQVIHGFLNDEVQRVYLFATFFGLILASIVFCARQVKVWGARQILALFIGAIIAFLFTGGKTVPSDTGMYHVVVSVEVGSLAAKNYDAAKGMVRNVSKGTLQTMLARGQVKPDTVVIDKVSGKQFQANELINGLTLSYIDFWLIGSGMLAVCALLLPGISGSYILAIMGVYPLLVAAMADLSVGLRSLSLDGDACFVIGNLVVGAVVGAVLFSHVISWLLDNYHNMAVSLLTGFIIGAMRTIWPFWTYAYYVEPLKLDRGPQLFVLDPYLPGFYDQLFLSALGFAVLGFSMVIIIEIMACINKKSKSTSS